MSNLHTLAMSVEKHLIDDQSEEQDPTYTGIIANKNLIADYTHLSSRVLRGFAASAREGVTVLANHNRGQVVGRSMSGTYANDEEVRSKFYIQRGLELAGSAFTNPGYASTDDYIKAINRGTYTDLSVGFRDYTEVCDFCGEEMKGGWFYTADKNGHYPGQKIYVDEDGNEYDEPARGRKEVIITAEVTEGTLFEYSLVDAGAVPGAEIVKQAQLMGMKPRQKQYMMSRYGLNIDEPGEDIDKIFRLGKEIDFLPENKSFSFPERKGDTSMNDEKVLTDEEKVLKSTDEETINDLNNQLIQAREKNAELSDKLKSHEDQTKDLSDAREEINKLLKEKTKLQNEVNELSVMKDEYDQAFSDAKEEAKQEWIRKSGTNPDMKEFEDTMYDIKRLSTVKSLTRRWSVQGDARFGTNGRSTIGKANEDNASTGIDVDVYDPQDYNL